MSALDFKKMMMQEKKRAKEEQQQNTSLDDNKVKDFPSSKSISSPISTLQNIYSFLPLSSEHLICSSFNNDLFCFPDYLENSSTKCQLLINDIVNDKKPFTLLQHSNRRVKVYGDDEPVSLFPHYLQELLDSLTEKSPTSSSSPSSSSSSIFPFDTPPNHILINEYDQNGGILPHSDGCNYLDTTATLSLGLGEVIMRFDKRLKSHEIGLKEDSGNCVKTEVLLTGGSLLVFRGDFYNEFLHSISSSNDIKFINEDGQEEGTSKDGLGGVYAERTSKYCFNSEAGRVVNRDYRISLTVRHKKVDSTRMGEEV